MPQQLPADPSLCNPGRPATDTYPALTPAVLACAQSLEALGVPPNPDLAQLVLDPSSPSLLNPQP